MGQNADLWKRRLPCDLWKMIERLIEDERHMTMRLLLRRTSREASLMCMRRSLTLHDITKACRMWSAIDSAGCYDNVLMHECRRQHDMWVNLLDDPYDMRGKFEQYRHLFQVRLEPQMWMVKSRSRTRFFPIR